jgi:hypothetical protein
MPAIEGMLAILGTFGMAPLIVYLRGKHKLRERELEIEAQRQKALPAGTEDGVKKLEDENKKLRERVENLESIVCSVDFELNQKLAKVIDEQRSLILPAGGAAGAARARCTSPTTWCWASWTHSRS